MWKAQMPEMARMKFVNEKGWPLGRAKSRPVDAGTKLTMKNAL